MAKWVIVSRYFTPRGYRALTLFPFVVVADKEALADPVLHQHEGIHLRQQLELLIIPFYLWYLTEYVYRRYQHRSHRQAYYNISFEREAYANEKDPHYLRRRSFWAFVKYL